MNNIRPNETRAVGWYALRWAHITDWYKSYRNYFQTTDRKKTTKPNKSIEEFLEDKADSPNVRNYAKHAIEERDRAAIEEIEEKRLREAVKEASNTLIKARTVFPFTLFPNTITIDRHKLTIVYRSFFDTRQTVSVPIENIKNIEADLVPFFGSLTITSDNFANNTQTINFLRRRDAIEIQKIVQGAMVAVTEEIDLSKVETDKLTDLLKKLGDVHTPI